MVCVAASWTKEGTRKAAICRVALFKLVISGSPHIEGTVKLYGTLQTFSRLGSSFRRNDGWNNPTRHNQMASNKQLSKYCDSGSMVSPKGEPCNRPHQSVLWIPAPHAVLRPHETSNHRLPEQGRLPKQRPKRHPKNTVSCQAETLLSPKSPVDRIAGSWVLSSKQFGQHIGTQNQ